MARIGFIGLGSMGGGMASNPTRKGHDVHAFDLADAARDRAAQAGCLPVGSALETAREAEAIITMLPAGTHVEQVYGESVFGTALTAAILIDCSTIDVATARRVADAAARRLTAPFRPLCAARAVSNRRRRLQAAPTARCSSITARV